MRVMIATPCYYGRPVSEYWLSVSALREALATSELDGRANALEHRLEVGNSVLAHARNMLLQKFIDSDADAMIFFDADQCARPSEFLALLVPLTRGWHVVGAAVPCKSIDWQAVRAAALRGEPDLSRFASPPVNVRLLPGDVARRSVRAIRIGPRLYASVASVGTGAMALSRRAAVAMAEAVPRYEMSDGAVRRSFPAIFESRVAELDGGTTFAGEDVIACELARTLGFEPLCLLDADIHHFGTWRFVGSGLTTLAARGFTIREEEAHASRAAE